MPFPAFHLAGCTSKNVTLGVPRLKELINVAKTVRTPSLSVKCAADLSEFKRRMEYTMLADLSEQCTVHNDPDIETCSLPEDQELVQDYYAFPDEEIDPARVSRWLARIVVSRDELARRKLRMADLRARVAAMVREMELQPVVIVADDNAATQVMHVRLVDEHDYEALTRVCDRLLFEAPMYGVQGVRNVFPADLKGERYDPELGAVPETANVYETDGSNLREALATPGIDPLHTVSNDPVEVLSVLGVEAAQEVLMRELRRVVEFDGSYVNLRHLRLLSDVMTHRGGLMAITRHGINRGDNGPLMRASFEETVEILNEAAFFAERDDLRGVTENVVTGQLAPFGTGAFDVGINEALLDGIEPERQAEAPAMPAMPAMPPAESTEFSIASPRRYVEQIRVTPPATPSNI